MPRQRTHRLALFRSVEDEIQRYRLTRASADSDVSLWQCKEGVYQAQFSTKATWQLLRVHRPIMEEHKGIWFPHATPKYAFITWLVVKNRIATGERMQHWHHSANTGCIFCGYPMESREHLFFQCPYSSQVWEALMKKFLAGNFTNRWQEVMSLLIGSVLAKKRRLVVGYVFQNTIHSLWRERNEQHHGETPSMVLKLVTFIDKNIRNRLSSIKDDGGSSIQLWFEARFN
ncbi:PREDICTED: uncharacterized protein LOC109131247 [Camelina sativa]|uniref:Uncharacterized protein LOC109131247 n=1 Tax=Camelina sativa TaxID=90675 RepID=A0ABM1REQ5_CAMSA|nr:PREDICTED: uncharacterized protein LOC109131247 [Camelina sativa]